MKGILSDPESASKLVVKGIIKARESCGERSAQIVAEIFEELTRKDHSDDRKAIVGK